MEGWIDIKSGASQGRLSWGDRCRVGGEGCDVVVADAQGDELHLWADPPRLVLSGSKTTPLVNGRALEECDLHDGDTIQWQGAVIVVHPAGDGVEEPKSAEERAAPQAPKPSYKSPGKSFSKSSSPNSAKQPGGGTTDPNLRQLSLADLPVARRVLAGIAAEMGVGNKEAIKRWQAAVLRGEWDADTCASEVLAGVDLESTALRERGGRIQRDLLMTSFQRGIRGAGRKARGAAKGGSAFLIANVLAFGVFSIFIAILLILARTRLGWSLDGLIDEFIQRVGETLGVGS